MLRALRTPVVASIASAAALALTLRPEPARAEQLRFAWPTPATVEVTEKVIKRGIPATLRYAATLAPAPDGKNLALTLAGFRFVDFNGMDPKSPKLRKQMAAALKVASAVPTLLISKEGRFEDVADLEPMIDKILAASKLPKAQRKAFQASMKSPEMLAVTRERAAEFWNVWVGLWAGRALQPGRSLDLAATKAIDGTAGDAPMTLRHEGIGGPPGHVRLSFESRLDPDTAPQALGRWLAAFLEQAGAATGRPIPRDAVEAARVVFRGEAITDPATLRPAAARSAREVAIKLRGEPQQSEVEIREYLFEWK